MRRSVRTQHSETTIGPVAIDGRTITLVARTRALHLGNDERGALHVRSRPSHVEILDADGRREVVRVRDTEAVLIAAVALAGLACAGAARLVKMRRSR